jgi:hypothetical protein
VGKIDYKLTHFNPSGILPPKEFVTNSRKLLLYREFFNLGIAGRRLQLSSSIQ